jgi:undecaprenyl-diphosphatase
VTTLVWLEAVVLGVIQGLTEFLPISSDGHLALGQALFDSLRGSRRSGSDKLLINIILHLGTLLAVLVYYRSWFFAFFHKESLPDSKGPLDSLEGVVPRNRSEFIRVTLLAIVATLPTGVIGLALKKGFEQAQDSLVAAALGFWFTALILWGCQKFSTGNKTLADTTFRDAFLIGLAQSLAPLPGVSRSGITVSSAIIRGLNPAWAAIFSLWISLPTIAGALLMETRDIMESPETESLLIKLGLAGACVSGIVGYGAIIWLVKAVKSRKLNLFAAYLTVLGFAVLVWSQLRGQ